MGSGERGPLPLCPVVFAMPPAASLPLCYICAFAPAIACSSVVLLVALLVLVLVTHAYIL